MGKKELRRKCHPSYHLDADASISMSIKLFNFQGSRNKENSRVEKILCTLRKL